MEHTTMLIISFNLVKINVLLIIVLHVISKFKILHVNNVWLATVIGHGVQLLQFFLVNHLVLKAVKNVSDQTIMIVLNVQLITICSLRLYQQLVFNLVQLVIQVFQKYVKLSDIVTLHVLLVMLWQINKNVRLVVQLYCQIYHSMQLIQKVLVFLMWLMLIYLTCNF